MQLQTHVVDVEQVLRSQNVPARDSHQADPGRLVGSLGRPVRKHILLRRSELRVGTPLEIQYTVDFDRFPFQHSHRRELVNRDLGSEMASGDILVVRRPSQQRPREFSGGRDVFGLCASGDRGWLNRLLAREGSEQQSGLDLPHSDLVTLIFGAELTGILRSVLVLGRFGDDRVGRPGHEVLFTGGKVEEFDTRVSESMRDGVLEGATRPEGYSDSVEGGQVSSFGRPRNIKLSPSL
jgi:hypothetical protein